IPPVTTHPAATPATPATPANSYPSPGHYDYFALSTHHDPSPPPPPPHVLQHSCWSSIAYPSGFLHSPDNTITSKYSSRFSLPLLSTDALSSSLGSSVSDVDYHLSPLLGQTYSGDDMAFGGASPAFYDGYSATSQHSPVTHGSPPGIVLDHHHHHHHHHHQEQQQQQQQQQYSHHHHHHARMANSASSGLLYAASEHGSSLDSTTHMDPFAAHLMNHKLMRECDGLGEHHMAPCSAFPF
ncbi:hypothetical protein E4U41_000169, partial [Claviceps citrina]